MKIVIFAAMLILFEFNFALWIPLIVILVLMLALSIFFQTKLMAFNDRLDSIYSRQRVLEHKIKEMHGFLERRANIPQNTSVKTVAPVSLSEIAKLKDEIDELKREIELKTELKEKIEGLKNEVRLIKTRVRADGLIPEKSVSRPEDAQSYKEPAREFFYLSTPNEDASFYNKAVHYSYKEGASIYKFAKTSDHEAEFQIIQREAPIKLALQYPDKNIDPACVAENAYNPKASRIVTSQSGRAVLNEDKWMVIRKAVIRYEY
ncbi:MAG TPA: hypothetical protein VGC76_19450 [Pyrinomonadaceae bacterium]|jgi:hypothetical protein